MLSYSLLTHKSCVFFRGLSEVEVETSKLTEQGWAVLRMNGSEWASVRDVHRDFATAMQVPKGYYRADEVFAPNANAFLEYLDDVAEWLPAKGHLYVVDGATSLLRAAPAIAGYLAELVQFSHLDRASDAKLVFVIEEEVQNA